MKTSDGFEIKLNHTYYVVVYPNIFKCKHVKLKGHYHVVLSFKNKIPERKLPDNQPLWFHRYRDGIRGCVYKKQNKAQNRLLRLINKELRISRNRVDELQALKEKTRREIKWKLEIDMK